MVQKVEFGSEIMFDLVQIENLFWTYFGPKLDLFWTYFGPILDLFWTYFGPILEEQGISVSINLTKLFTSAHPIHYSRNRNILSKNYDAFFFRTKRI